MSTRWLCDDCGQETANPSFSEGPKTTDPATGVESVRFKLARHLCPSCLSPNIKPIPAVDQPTLQ